MRSSRFGVAVSIAAALVVALAGCAATPAKVTSTWPVATTEATVTPPIDAQRFPLTGLPVPAGATYPISPMCAKLVDNGATATLSGVSAADVVYETGQAGAGTQIAALFQSAAPKTVGPLGAAGSPDLWILPQYSAALFSTGASTGLAASIKRAGLIDFSAGSAAGDSAYETLTHPKAAAGTYLSGARALQQVTALGSTIASDSARLRYASASETTGSATAGLTIPFSANQVVGWSWNAKSSRYLRLRNGRAQRDLLGKKRISASNVVVMWAKYTALDTDVVGPGGYDITLGGSGQVTVFRDGQRIDGRWKADGASPPTFYADSGQAIRLAAGTTWFEVIPLSTNISMR
ncbi:MAG: DUF3048 C-terminal domain-containing protein [Coriobacteriia bacterium]|nr:DUF3048 C-terminal domain-containing protein [Coriobacteriia bacterium]